MLADTCMEISVATQTISLQTIPQPIQQQQHLPAWAQPQQTTLGPSGLLYFHPLPSLSTGITFS